MAGRGLGRVHLGPGRLDVQPERPPGETYQVRAVAEMQLGSGLTDTQTTGTCTVGG